MARSGWVIPAQLHANVHAYPLRGVHREADADPTVLLARADSLRSATEPGPSMTDHSSSNVVKFAVRLLDVLSYQR